MTCAMTLYKDRADAFAVKRRLAQRTSLVSSIIFCEACDGYHVKAMSLLDPELSRDVKILQLVAQGYYCDEIARITHAARPRLINDALHAMRRRFYASTTANLIAIAISIGIIEPAEFLPHFQEEATGHEPRDVQRRSAQRNLA